MRWYDVRLKKSYGLLGHFLHEIKKTDNITIIMLLIVVGCWFVLGLYVGRSFL